MTDERLAMVEALTAFARSRDRSVLELAMSWLASHPIVASVIAGATSPEQVRQNAAAAGWRLTEAERAEIDRIADRNRVALMRAPITSPAPRRSIPAHPYLLICSPADPRPAVTSPVDLPLPATKIPAICDQLTLHL